MRSSRGLSEPPAGAVVGEDVPLENDRDEIEEALIDEMVGLLKTHPAYHGKRDETVREAAINKLQKAGDIR